MEKPVVVETLRKEDFSRGRIALELSIPPPSTGLLIRITLDVSMTGLQAQVYMAPSFDLRHLTPSYAKYVAALLDRAADEAYILQKRVPELYLKLLEKAGCAYGKGS